MARKKKLNEIVPTESAQLPSICDNFGRVKIIQEDTGSKIAEKLTAFLGLEFESRLDSLAPAAFDQYRSKIDAPAFMQSGRLSGMGCPFIFECDRTFSTILLESGMGNPDDVVGGGSADAFKPAGLAVLDKISEKIFAGITAGWDNFSAGELAAPLERWTNPAHCRFFHPEEPMIVSRFIFSSRKGMGGLAMLLPQRELSRHAHLLMSSEAPRVCFGPVEAAPAPERPKPWWRSLFGSKKTELFHKLLAAPESSAAFTLESEHPQVAAAALACIPSRQAVKIMEHLSMDRKREIIIRIKKIDIRQGSLLTEVDQVLSSKLSGLQPVRVAVNPRDWG